jgi:hypothetical protein
VDNDESLPAAYHEWAARPRGVSELYVLQQPVDASSATLGVTSFEVTPTQVMSFKNFRFVGAAYHGIGTGLLPFSITTSDATSPHARAMLAADRTRADAFDLGGDPESGAIAPGDVSRLRNLSCYNPQSWMEARNQLHSSQALMGALLGVEHPLVGEYGRFLRQYERLTTRLESEVDQVHGRRLGPSLVTFHIQLMWCNWLVAQLDAAQTDWVDPPVFGVVLSMMEDQKKLMWLPTVTNVPLLLSLRHIPHVGLAATPSARVPVARAPTARAATPASDTASAAVAARRDAGRHVRNPNHAPRFAGNTPFAQNVRSQAVLEAIATAGPPPPMVIQKGVSGPLYISWHARGQCFENCTRSADHGVLNEGEATAFHTWCELAYA